MAVIEDSLRRKITNGLRAGRGLCRKQRIDFEYLVGTRPNADQSTENQIDIGGVAVVVRAIQANDGAAGVRIVVLLNIRARRRDEVLLRVLAQQAQIVGSSDLRLRIIIEKVSQGGERLRGLERPGRPIPLALRFS